MESDSDIDTTSSGGFNGVDNPSDEYFFYDIFR